MAQKFTLTVNGERREIGAEPETTLLHALRHDLSLASVRFGCGMGQCGACLVLVDGRAATSCDMPMWSVDGKDVTTVEGLARDGAPHPVQEAFLAEQAAQCGYCVSGMLISAVALLAGNPHPDRAQIGAALERNLCRCGVHQRIVRAVARAADASQASP